MHLGGFEGLGHCWERERERSDGSTEGRPRMAQPLGDVDSWKCGTQVSEKEVTNLGVGWQPAAVTGSCPGTASRKQLPGALRLLGEAPASHWEGEWVGRVTQKEGKEEGKGQN